jgi:glutathione S-transferase
VGSGNRQSVRAEGVGLATGLVPTIEDGDVRLWESNVIVRYLSHKHSMGELCPADIVTRFDAERWMDWQTAQFWAVLRPLYIALIRTPVAQRDAGVISRAEMLSKSAVRMLDLRLADRPFLAGDAFTMGDIPAAVTVSIAGTASTSSVRRCRT